MQLTKYKGQEVEVGLMLPTSFTSWQEQRDGKPVTLQESDYENCVNGKVVDAGADWMVVESEHRSKVYRYEVAAHAVAFVLTTKLTESGKAASERMKRMHKAPLK